jgi:hypothetical protein
MICRFCNLSVDEAAPILQPPVHDAALHPNPKVQSETDCSLSSYAAHTTIKTTRSPGSGRLLKELLKKLSSSADQIPHNPKRTAAAAEGALEGALCVSRSNSTQSETDCSRSSYAAHTTIKTTRSPGSGRLLKELLKELSVSVDQIPHRSLFI